MFVCQTKETAAILVYQINPLGSELFPYVNTFFPNKSGKLLCHMSENALLEYFDFVLPNT